MKSKSIVLGLLLLPFLSAYAQRPAVDAGQLLLDFSNYRTGEAGPAMITVTRRGAADQTLSVRYSTSDISARAGVDYISTARTLTFAEGETKKVFAISILNDSNPESTETLKITLSSLTGAVLEAATVTIFDDDTPSGSGKWGPIIALPVVPIHMHLLPTGKVMFWDRYDHAKDWNGDPYLWDPFADTAPVKMPLPGYDVFCSGHAFMADGSLLVAGGHIGDGVGDNKAARYDPFANAWHPLPNMNAGRWYPTNTTLANGDVLVLAGTTTGGGTVNPLPQVWQTANGTWRNLTTATQGGVPAWSDFYPFLYLAANGKVFNAGPQRTSRYLDVSGTGAWSDVADSSLLYRDYGSSVMYAGGKVLIVGGNPREAASIPTILPSATAEVIDLDTPAPAWRSVPPMAAGRRHLNTTILPDGKILVTGGSAFPGADNRAGAVFFAEMWDPETEAWTIMAGHSKYRGYHSNAMLLADGRVLVAGGGHPDPPADTEPENTDPHTLALRNAEIYSPPYLFKGARPEIKAVPATIDYGQSFFVETPSAQSITNVNWIRLSSVTHAFNQNQRINRLGFSQSPGGLQVTSPSDPNLCPPGHYMLFVLNRDGVPSIAKIIRVGPGSTIPPALIIIVLCIVAGAALITWMTLRSSS
jgi:hypothetical protein